MEGTAEGNTTVPMDSDLSSLLDKGSSGKTGETVSRDSDLSRQNCGTLPGACNTSTRKGITSARKGLAG